MEIVVIVHIRTCINLMTGAESSTATTVTRFYDQVLNGNIPQLYGAVVWTPTYAIYSIYETLQQHNFFMIYAFPKDAIIYDQNGLIIAGWLGGGVFYE